MRYPKKSRKTSQKRRLSRKQVSQHGFDSDTEYRRFQRLTLLQRVGVIRDLECQPQFELMPRIKVKANGIHKGYTQSREIYTADFRYLYGDTVVIEDVKGIKKTKTGKLKPYIKTPSRNKIKRLINKWHAAGLLSTHCLLITAEHGRDNWVYFDSNSNLLEFDLSELLAA